MTWFDLSARSYCNSYPCGPVHGHPVDINWAMAFGILIAIAIIVSFVVAVMSDEP